MDSFVFRRKTASLVEKMVHEVGVICAWVVGRLGGLVGLNRLFSARAVVRWLALNERNKNTVYEK